MLRRAMFLVVWQLVGGGGQLDKLLDPGPKAALTLLQLNGVDLEPGVNIFHFAKITSNLVNICGWL